MGALTLACALGLMWIIWRLAHPLALLIAAITLAQALSPLVRVGERYLPRAIAILGIYALVFSSLGIAGWLVVPALAGQAQEVATQLPKLLEGAQAQVDHWGAFPGLNILEMLQSSLLGAAGTLVTVPLGLASSALELVIVVILSLYWLIASPPLLAFTLSLFPAGRRPEVARVLGRIGWTMGGYLRAMVIGAAVIGVVVYVGLSLVGVRYPLVLALLAAMGEMVPILGPFLAAAPALLVALLESPGQALAVLMFFAVIQQLESHLLIPNLMSHQADVPPALSIFALTAGAALGGLLGAIIAIPVAGAIQVLVVEVLAPAIRMHFADADVGAIEAEPLPSVEEPAITPSRVA